MGVGTGWNGPLAMLGMGLGIGLIGTLIGAGGGFVLAPALLLLYPSAPPGVITAVSLAVVFLNAGSGSVAYARLRRIDHRSGAAFALATVPGSIGGALLARALSRKVFDPLLGALLLALAVLTLFGFPHGPAGLPGPVTRDFRDAAGHRYQYGFSMPLGVSLSAGVGFLSSLLGIGGGPIHVPLLVGLLNFPVHVATATSHFVLAVMAGTGTAVHLAAGDLRGAMAVPMLLGVGVLAGAQAGAHLSSHLHGRRIEQLLGGALLLIAIRLLLRAL